MGEKVFYVVGRGEEDTCAFSCDDVFCETFFSSLIKGTSISCDDYFPKQ